MKYSLIKKNKTDEFDYIDQDGVSFNSPDEWLFIGILGGCGCGSYDDFGKDMIKLLKFFSTPHENREWSIYDDRYYELLSHWMDNKKLIEHGSGIGGAWLTEKGNNILDVIKFHEEVFKISK